MWDRSLLLCACAVLAFARENRLLFFVCYTVIRTGRHTQANGSCDRWCKWELSVFDDNICLCPTKTFAIVAVWIQLILISSFKYVLIMNKIGISNIDCALAMQVVLSTYDFIDYYLHRFKFDELARLRFWV